MSKYTPLLFLILALFSCSTDKKLEQKEENQQVTSTYTDGNIVLTQNTVEEMKGIIVSNFGADTGVNTKEQGIRTFFTLQVDKFILDQIHTDGFDALLVNIVCKGNSGKEYSYLKTYLPELSGMVVYPDKNIVFAHPAKRSLQIDIPYRKLELSPSLQALTISLLIYPIKFSPDTNRVETKRIDRICSAPLYSQHHTARVHAPQLKQNIIALTDIKIKTTKKKASSYDFTLTGNGLPDPYWQIWCGEELIYFSPSEKNTLTVNGIQTSCNFYTAANDLITIKFLDYDNGPFNRDDLIETIEGTATELKKLKKINGQIISTVSIQVKQQ